MRSKVVSHILREVAQLLELKGDNPFRIRAYQRAARVIEGLGDDLEDIVKQDDLTSMPGIGKDLSAKIKEIVTTGTLQYYEQLKEDIPVGLIQMLGISGLGPRTVKHIYDELKIDGVDDLEEAIKSGKLRKLEGVKEKTEENILRGIKFLKKGIGKIPFYLASDIGNSFAKQIGNIKEVEEVMVAGSLRRGKDRVRDIDILVASKRSKMVIDKFVKLPLIEEILSRGEYKASVIVKDPSIQVDLRVVESKSFGAALMYFTGSKEFNIKLRQLAIKMGYKVNEYGLFFLKPGGKEKLIAAKTEKDIFSAMGMDYIVPELREDRGEIAAALNNQLPKLIQRKDVLGDLHVHSNYSDGEDKIEDIVIAAKKIGYKYIGISDHSQSLRIAGGLSVEELHKKIEEIRKINKEVKDIEVFCGAEVDILSDGRLDYPDSVLKQLDYVIAAIHSGFKQSKKDLTNRIILACKNKNVNIISHPTGVLRGVREGYEIDLDQILKVAGDNGVALEINCHPQRSDLSDNASLRAKRAGVELCLGTDAHIVEGLKLIDLGVQIARRGWLEQKNVINCLKKAELIKWLKK